VRLIGQRTRPLLWAWLLPVLLLAGMTARASTWTAATTYVYDAPSAARVEVHQYGAAAANPAQLSDMREGSASRSGEARGTSTTSRSSFIATEAGGGLGGVDTGVAHGPLGRPNFVAHPNGEIIAVPEGAVGPTMVRTGKGIEFTGGSGGRGLDPRVTSVRVMDPVTTGKYPYPNGYVSYSNAAEQAVNPVTGGTVSKTDPWWHIPWS
jgi:hypothetical protein